MDETYEPIAAMRGVSKEINGRSGDGLLVLDRLDFEIRPRDYISIVGASGGGKSTFLNILGLLLPHDSGKVYVNGEEVGAVSQRRRAEIRRDTFGYVFQSFLLLPELDAVANVALPLIYRGLTRAEAHERAKQSLDDVGLYGRHMHLPQQLSGGQQQRVAIARALVSEPDVLLADEPTGNLDTETGRDVIALIEKARDLRAMAIVLVTHDQALASRAQQKMRLSNARLDGEAT